MLATDSKTLACALGLLASLLLAAGCGPKKVCECAVHVGGTTPASGAESDARRDAVSACLERHGGGTISGCPMPPSAMEDPEPASVFAGIEEEPQAPTHIEESAGPADPFEPLRDVIVAIDHQDIDGIALAFHPALRDAVREELAGEDDDISVVQTCLERTVEIGATTPVTELPQRLSEMGVTEAEVLGLQSSDGRQALVVLHEGRYVLLDSGC